MSKQKRNQKNRRHRNRQFLVDCIEAGYAIIVDARSAEEAEAIVTRRLDEECDALDGSERVHYDGFVASSREVLP